MHELEDYEEVVRALLEKMPPELRLMGLAPEERVAGLAPEERVLILTDDTLRAFPDEYLPSLPPHVREAIRPRIGRPS